MFPIARISKKEGTCLSYLEVRRNSCQQVAGALTAGARGFFRAGRHRLCTELAKAVSPIERDSVSGWKRALADGTSKAVGMVGLAQGGHHLSFHELPAAVAACPIHPLVVQRAQILSVLYEEAPLGQVTAAHFAGETFDVEMFGLDPKHFALAWLPTFVAVNDRLLWRVVRVLGVSHLRHDSVTSQRWSRSLSQMMLLRSLPRKTTGSPRN